MALARALDERAWILNRSGRVHFVISGQGHEGAEAGVTAALTPGRDWLLPYYRSMTGVMAMGMTPREVMLQQYGKADDPGSGGRQMPSHYGHAGHRIFSSSSPVATQVLHAAGIALAAKLRGVPEVALVAMGEGSSNQGDVHEALNFAGVHRLPMILLVENNGYAISVPAELQSRGARRGRPGSRLRDAGRRRGRQRRDRLLPRGARRGGPGAGGRGPHLHRGEGDPAHRPQLRRPADEVPIGGGARRAARAGPAAALPRRAARGRRAVGGGRGRSRGRGGRGRSTTRPRSRRRRPTRTRPRSCATCTPSPAIPCPARRRAHAAGSASGATRSVDGGPA